MTTNKFDKQSKIKIFKNNILDFLLSIAVLLIMIIIITNPKRYTSGTISGLKLFFYAVLPGLFPFMFLTKLLTDIGFVYKISPKFEKLTTNVFGTPGISFYAFFMSILSGYPIGAKIIGDLYEKDLVTQSEAKKMAVFCTTSGPIFVIGAVGIGMFFSLKYGIILYISHIVSSVFVGIIYNFFDKNKCKNKPHQPQQLIAQKSDNIISNCLLQTVNSLFIVSAYITIFYLFTEILDGLKVINIASNFIAKIFKFLSISNNDANGLVYGIFEVTHGLKVLSQSKNIISCTIASGILSLGGLSILMQEMAFFKQAKIKTRYFVFSKCVHMVLSMILTYLLLIITANMSL